MNRNKVIFTSHCVLNKASKVTYYGEKKITNEEIARREFVKLSLEKDICIIQLPCPEFNIYGANRWGHTKDQFNNTFFKDNCKKMLESYILQLEEYLNETDKFEVLGIVGIEGSPSCGVNLTCEGKWGGEMSSRSNLQEVIKSINMTKEKGIFMEILEKMLIDRKIVMPMMSINQAVEVIKKIN